MRPRCFDVAVVLSLLFSCSSARAAEDILLADFESKDYAPWKVEGEAFGPGPARGTLDRQQNVTGFLGQGLVNTYFKQDASRGTLTSPAFKVERRYLNFLIGG